MNIEIIGFYLVHLGFALDSPQIFQIQNCQIQICQMQIKICQIQIPGNIQLVSKTSLRRREDVFSVTIFLSSKRSGSNIGRKKLGTLKTSSGRHGDPCWDECNEIVISSLSPTCLGLSVLRFHVYRKKGKCIIFLFQFLVQL